MCKVVDLALYVLLNKETVVLQYALEACKRCSQALQKSSPDVALPSCLKSAATLKDLLVYFCSVLCSQQMCSKAADALNSTKFTMHAICAYQATIAVCATVQIQHMNAHQLQLPTHQQTTASNLNSSALEAV